MSPVRDDPKPFVRILRDYTIPGETEPRFRAGEGVFAHRFQQLLEDTGRLDRTAYPRPPFACVRCSQPVTFRKKGVNTSSATFVRDGDREDHHKECLFSQGAKAVRLAQEGQRGQDRGDPLTDYPNRLVPPRKKSSSGAAGTQGAPDDEDVPPVDTERLPRGRDPRGREVRIHTHSLLKVFCDRYARVVDLYSDNVDDVAEHEALKGMRLKTDNPDVFSYYSGFIFLLSKMPDPGKKGNRIWFFKIGRAIVCADGIIVEAKDTKKAPDNHGVAVVKMAPSEIAGSQLLADLEDAACLYVYGTVEEREYKGQKTRFVSPAYLEWVNAGEHPWWGQSDFDIVRETRTIDDVLRPSAPAPVTQQIPTQPVFSLEAILEPPRTVGTEEDTDQVPPAREVAAEAPVAETQPKPPVTAQTDKTTVSPRKPPVPSASRSKRSGIGAALAGWWSGLKERLGLEKDL